MAMKVDSMADRKGGRYLAAPLDHACLFTIVTLVADQQRHDALLDSAADKGGDVSSSGFLALDTRGANDGGAVKGRGIVFTHDDIEIHADSAAGLAARLDKLTAQDPGWTRASNAGGIRFHRGGHFHAGDLGRVSEVMGARTCAIPVRLRPNAGGKIGATLAPARARFSRKSRRNFIGRNLPLTVTGIRFGFSGLCEGLGETVHSPQTHLQQNLYAPGQSGVA